MGSDKQQSLLQIILQYFNPRSRTGSDLGYHIYVDGNGISIHAPARGATYLSINVKAPPSISIHAPARGATWGSLIDRLAVWISIHAPTWGATQVPGVIPGLYLF